MKFVESVKNFFSSKNETINPEVTGQITNYLESLARLELEIEDRGWEQLNQKSNEVDFSIKARKSLQKQAFIYWLKNPLIGRAVEIKTDFIFGDGISYKAKGEKVQEVLNLFWNDDDNKREITTLKSQQIKSRELQIYANLYFAFYTDPVSGQVKIRTIPDTEIEDVITDPDDYQKPLWYKRVRSKKTYNFEKEKYETKKEVTYYADWRQGDNPEISPPINKINENWELYHVKENHLTHQKFGITELYRAMDWAGAYKNFLEDLLSVWKTLSKFPVKNKQKASKGQLASQAAKLKEALSTLTTTGEVGPKAGSVWTENQGSDFQPLNIQGATLRADDGRRILLMVCAATGLIEPFFGDPATANLATMSAMMGPMLKMFKSKQEFWKSVFADIFDYVIDRAIESGIIEGVEEKDAYGNVYYVLAGGEEKTVEIDMPHLDEKDIPKMIESITKLDGSYLVPADELSRIVMNLLDIDNVDRVLEKMYPEGAETPGIEIPHGEEEEVIAESLVETVRNIQKTLAEMKGV